MSHAASLMKTSSPSATETDHAILVTVYGLKCRKSAKRLIDALAGIPCFPVVIFRIDQFGRLLGVVEQVGDATRLYYVQVRRWGRGLPEIGWTTEPDKISRGLRRKSINLLLEYTTAVRKQPMSLRYSGEAHRQLAARMA